MTVRRPLLVAVLAGLIALAILAAVGVGTRGDSPEGAAQRPASPASPSSASATPDASSTATADGTPAGDEATDDASAPAPAPSTDDATSSSAGPKQEIPTDTRSPGSGLPGLEAAARQERASKAELRASFPALQVRRAALVADHPRHTVPVPHGTTVQSSSLATDAGVTQVGLVIHVDRSVGRAMRFYRIRLGRVGFREVGQPAVPSGDAASFRRGTDRIVVLAQAGQDTAVTVHATLQTGG